jgi:sugar O-acyltransferase (sialic acid O-acetyltransferase NeuD family)
MGIHKKLLIIGASGHGKVIAEIAFKMSKWEEIAFLDDEIQLNSFMGAEVIGRSNDFYSYTSDYDIFVGIGDNKIREKFYDLIEETGATVPSLVHPKAIIGEQVVIGKGTAIMAGVVINSCCHIGIGAIINTGATIDHDNILSNFVHISPGVHTAGNVKIGKNNWIGIGSTISNNVCITDYCVIGAGSVVIDTITVQGTYVGVPVRRIDNNVEDTCTC